MTPDTPSYYGSVSRFLHWLMAAGFLFMFASVALPKWDEDYNSLMGYHKITGYFLFWLVILRIFWAVKNRAQRPEGHIAVKIGHGALYLLMFAVPAIGLIRQYGGGRGPLEFAGINWLPAAGPRIEWMTKLGGALHGELGWVLFVLAGGHILAAIAHQIKGEKIINRMAGPRR